MERATADSILGFYGPDSMMWRINREAVLLGAGPAALLLQIAHPLVARGVAEHSTFETDPFRRLRGTLRTTMDLVFGNGRASERAVRRLNRVHASVRGIEYRALDPDLLLWVQATLIVTSVNAYERWVGHLTAAQRNQFWQEARHVGVRLGIPLSVSPPDWPALLDYWQRMLAADGPIKVSPVARRLAPLIIRPPLPLMPGPVVDLLALPGLALLPNRLREEFGISWSPGRQRAAHIASVVLRTWVKAMPARLRAMPPATTALRRAGQTVPRPVRRVVSSTIHRP